MLSACVEDTEGDAQNILETNPQHSTKSGARGGNRQIKKMSKISTVEQLLDSPRTQGTHLFYGSEPAEIDTDRQDKDKEGIELAPT